MACKPHPLAVLMRAPCHTWSYLHTRLHFSATFMGSRSCTTCAAPASQPTVAASEYVTLAQPCRTEVEVKKSKFIVTAWPVTSGKQALALIKQHSDLGATHNCYAYRVGDESRSNDDGEPGGTAGRPILTAIDGEELQGVAVLVTRHYGGIKLGAGGLVRAYGGAARTCLRAAPRATVRARAKLRIRAGFEVLGSLYNLLDKYSCERLSEDYDEGGQQDPGDNGGTAGGGGGGGGAVVLLVGVDAGDAAALVAAVFDATSGAVVPQYVQAEGQGEDEDG